jgi:5'-deoxynucleotidase YfbR-like HD superfamily hydrolase
MYKYTKSQKKKLRELAGIANELELDQELEKLYRHFESWRKKEISCFELSDLIHTFHQGASREIWKIYTSSDPDTAVSRAVALGLLKKEEIPENLLDILDLKIGFFTDSD